MPACGGRSRDLRRAASGRAAGRYELLVPASRRPDAEVLETARPPPRAPAPRAPDPAREDQRDAAQHGADARCACARDGARPPAARGLRWRGPRAAPSCRTSCRHAAGRGRRALDRRRVAPCAGGAGRGVETSPLRVPIISPPAGVSPMRRVDGTLRRRTAARLAPLLERRRDDRDGRVLRRRPWRRP